jgi:hypothetical protein
MRIVFSGEATPEDGHAEKRHSIHASSNAGSFRMVFTSLLIIIMISFSNSSVKWIFILGYRAGP